MIFFIIVLLSISMPFYASQPLALSGKTIKLTFSDMQEPAEFPGEFVESFMTPKSLIEDLGSPEVGIPLNIKQSEFNDLKFLLEPLATHDKSFPWDFEYKDLKYRFKLRSELRNSEVKEGKKDNESNILKPIKFYDLLMAANYLNPSNRDILYVLAALYVDYELENNEFPLGEHINDLKQYIAGALFANVLAGDKLPNDSFNMQADDLGWQSSDQGIVCFKEGHQYYCRFEKDTLVIDKDTRIFDGRRNNGVAGVSPDGKYMYYTFDSGGLYFMGVTDLSIKSTWEAVSSWRYVTAVTAHVVSGSQLPPELLRRHPYKISSSSWSADNNIRLTGIIYNPSDKGFFLTFIKPDKKEFIIAHRPGFNLETHFDLDIKVFRYADFKNDEGYQLQDTDIPTITWHYVDKNIIGVNVSGNYCFSYDPITKELKYLNKKKVREKYVILKLNHDSLTRSAAQPKSSFIPDLQALLNKKIAECKSIANPDHTYFDFIYLRYLQSRSVDPTSGQSDKKIYVTDVLLQKFAKAWRFMEKSFNDGAYQNMDVDAWWVNHAQRNTEIFKSLPSNSPIIARVSKYVLELYPPHQLLKRPSTSKQAPDMQRYIGSTLSSIRRGFYSAMKYPADLCQRWPKACAAGIFVGASILLRLISRSAFRKYGR